MRKYSKLLVSLNHCRIYNIRIRTFKLASSCGEAASNKASKNEETSTASSPNSSSLSDKVAMVTGGTSTFGIVCVKELIRCGIKGVMIADSNEREGQQKLCQVCTDCETDRIAFIRSDLENVLLLRNAFYSTKTHFKQIDIILNVTEQGGTMPWVEEINKNIKGIVRSTLLGYEFMGFHKGGCGGTVCNLIISPTLDDKELCPILSATKNHLVSLAKAMSLKFNRSTGVKVITAFAENNPNKCTSAGNDKDRRSKGSLSKMLESASPGSVWTLHFIKRNK